MVFAVSASELTWRLDGRQFAEQSAESVQSQKTIFLTGPV